MSYDTATYLKYANLQMAAEALLDRPDPGGLEGQLMYGNNRTSKFTTTQAEQFVADGWIVKAHQSNTSTGFSGTLFQNTLTGEQVVSFRSTEFIDDSARDNLATNTLEIKEKGWAFGQIADMEAWYASLAQDNKLAPGKPISVTGYSLGGHLATAFNLLHKNDLAAPSVPLIKSTYTFNGAGVGLLNVLPHSGVTLSGVIQDFVAHRGVGANASTFTTEEGSTRYTNLSLLFSPGSIIAPQAIVTAVQELSVRLEQPIVLQKTRDELNSLREALRAMLSIANEAVRVSGLSNGNSPPVAVSTDQIEAATLDYQLAVLSASNMTRPAAGLIGGTYQGVVGRNEVNSPIPNFYDVYGSNFSWDNFSAVSNSQLHYGKETAIFIEDQPLYRGSILPDVASASWKAGEIKLLVPEFSQNDFGDTHSLSLLIDSLSVQNALAQLDPAATQTTLNAILRASANHKAVSTAGTQGVADGDTLENLVNALGAYLGVDRTSDGWVELKGHLVGGTWANIASADGYTGRDALHNNLKLIAQDPDYQELMGKVKIEAATAGLVDLAKKDFGALIALQTLSPLLLKAKDTTNQTALNELWSNAWSDEYALWQSDKAAWDVKSTVGARTYTDSWLTDRAEMLKWIVSRNTNNIEEIRSPGVPQSVIYSDADSSTLFSVANTNAGPQAPLQAKLVIFGGDEADELSGQGRDDHIYGGDDDDILKGQAGGDYLEGNTGDDELDGGADGDMLVGGTGDDTYLFSSAFGKDTIVDSDDLGSIKIDGSAISTAAAIGQRNRWIAELPSGAKAELAVYDDARSSTGKKLVINRPGDANNTITINNFDLIKAQNGGYLGVKLESTVKLVLQEGGGSNPFKDPSFNPATVSGSSLIDEGSGSPYVLFLNIAAKAGDTITLSLSAMGDKFKVVLGDRTVDADGAVITLVEGQDKVTFSLVQKGDVTADANGLLSASYQGGNQAADSNPWTINLKDAGEVAKTFIGDQRGQTVTNPQTGDQSYDWASTSWTPEGVLTGGVVDAGYKDVIKGGAGNDKIDGKGGNDLLYGDDGNDEIEGGDGDDLIGGGKGSDTINGGAGNDVILSATSVAGSQRGGPTDNWDPSLLYHGGGIEMDDASDAIDAGDGDDLVYAGRGDDRIEGGAGDDKLWGLEGDDIIEGGLGADELRGDGVNTPGGYDYTPAASHGNDFLDGGEGNDKLWGYGQDDSLFGGAGNDVLWGDWSGSVLPGEYHGSDYLDGEDGDDILLGYGKADTLYGGAGNDVLIGDAAESEIAGQYHGDDYLDGEDGDDHLTGNGGNDTLYGGDGADELKGDASESELAGQYHGSDYLDGEAGDDILYGYGGSDTLYGGDDDDSMEGDAAESVVAGEYHGDDYLDGEGGNDHLWGEGGNDTLYGGDGDDQIKGDADESLLAAEYHGDDYLDGEDGADLIIGDGGNDTLYGGDGSDELQGDASEEDLAGEYHGDDYLNGEGGNDTLFGAGGDDTLYGGQGNDILVGDGVESDVSGEYHGNDFLDGEAGDDNLTGNGGDDTLIGGAGNDKLYGDNDDEDFLQTQYHGNDFLDGGEGNDYVEGGGGEDTVLGGAGDDMLWGDADENKVSLEFHGNDTLDGGAGADALVGGGGDDILLGGDGNDTLRGDAGNDRLEGGAGDDILMGGDGDDILIDTEGNNTFDGGTGSDTITVGDQDNNLQGGDGNDTLTAGDGDNTLNGGSGTDQLTAGDGDNTLNGDEGNDTISSGSGNDVLSGGEGNDSLSAGDGNNTLSGDQGNDTITSGSGNDALNGGEGNDVLSAGDGNNAVLGGSGNDSLTSGAGIDNLSGGSGNDTLHAGSGNDVLTGGEGDDMVYGEGGDDVLYANYGKDMLAGGDGLDTYVLGYDADRNTVVDDSAEGSVIKLGSAGMKFEDLSAVRRANDLVVEVRGTSASMRIKDYYASTQTSWVFEDAQGNTTTGEALVAASRTDWASLQANLLKDFQSTALGSIARSYVGGGYTQRVDGSWYRPADYSLYVTKTSTQRTEFSMDVYVPRTDPTNSWSTTTSHVGAKNWDTGVQLERPATDTTATIAFQTNNIASGTGTIQSYNYTSSLENAWSSVQWTKNYSTHSESEWDLESVNGGPEDPVTVNHFTREDIDEDYYTGTANQLTFQDPGPPALDGDLPDYVAVDFLHQQFGYNLGPSLLADGDQTVWADSYAAVIGGVGNNTIYGAGFAYGGTGNAQLIGGGTLMAGTGDQYLERGEIMVVGDGHDTLVGLNDGEKRSRILVNPDNLGIDLIGQDFDWENDNGDHGQSEVIDAIYQAMGYGDWERRYQYGGKFYFDSGEDSKTYFDSMDEARAAFVPTAQWPTFDVALADPYTSWGYMEPLAVLYKTPYTRVENELVPSNYYDTHPLAVTLLTANDFAALQPLLDAGVIPASVVSFGPGLALADLTLSWGEATAPIDGATHVTLDILWGTDQGIRIMMPRSGDALNSVVQQFEFSDGTVSSLLDLIALAPPAPDFDTGYPRIYAGMGEQSADAADVAGIRAVVASAGELKVESDGVDLVISIIGSSDSLRIVGWYADSSTMPQPVLFTSGATMLSAAEMTARGLLKDGSAGDLDLYGVPGFATTFIAGPNTRMTGNSGMDIYVYNAGSGEVHISDPGGGAVRFGSGVSAVATLGLGEGSLVINLGNQGDIIHLENFDPADAENFSSVLDFEFADGSVLSLQDLLDQGFDLSGTSDADTITGTSVTDRILAGAGDDLLQGGRGDDTLGGGAGSDVYLFSSGDGLDTINEDDSTAGNVDTIRFDDSVSVADVRVSREGFSLYLSMDGSTDRIEISNWFAEGADTVEQVEFADGTVWGKADLEARLPTLVTGTEGDEVLDGSEAFEILDGQGGSDILSGGAGNDVYLFKRGDGQDLIDDYDETLGNIDAIRFDSDISAADVRVTRDSYGHLFLGIDGTEDRIQLNNWLQGEAYQVERVLFADGTVWNQEDLEAMAVYGPSEGRDFLEGTEDGDFLMGLGGVDELYGMSGNDIIDGGSGDDEIEGGEGDDLVAGGTGDDRLNDEAGSDVYLYSRGDGSDYIQDYDEIVGNVDTLRFYDGTIVASDVKVTRSFDELYLDIVGTGDRITLGGWFIGGGSSQMEQIEFYDGTVWSAAMLESLVVVGDASEDSDELVGTTGDDTINGLGGEEDQLFGMGGNDTLDGGAGLDYLSGGVGSDVYLFGRGSGEDVIDDFGESVADIDTLRFNNSVEVADITVSRDVGGTLFLSINGTDDKVQINNWFADAPLLAEQIERIEFHDGTVWTSQTLSAMATFLGTPGQDYFSGSQGNDMLRGLDGNDILFGGDGSDVLEGGAGNDNLMDMAGSSNYFNGGSGDDQLLSDVGANLFIGGTGNDSITSETGPDVIAFNVGDGQDTLHINGFEQSQDDTISLGGAGLDYANLSLEKNGSDLVLKLSGTDQLTLTDWYGSTPKQTVLNLQLVSEAMAAFDANSSDPLLNKKVQTFDFQGLVGAFDAARTATPGLSSWALSNGLTQFHLAGSDSEALGGDLAYHYGADGTLAGMGLGKAQEVLTNAQFGAQAQTIHSTASLQEGLVRLG